MFLFGGELWHNCETLDFPFLGGDDNKATCFHRYSVFQIQRQLLKLTDELNLILLEKYGLIYFEAAFDFFTSVSEYRIECYVIVI